MPPVVPYKLITIVLRILAEFSQRKQRGGGVASPKGRPATPAGATAARGHSRLQHGARKGGRLQGARKWLSLAAIPIANRDDGASRRGGRPLVRRLPAGKGSRCLRKGNGGDDSVKGKEGLGHPLEKRMILPLYIRKILRTILFGKPQWRGGDSGIHDVVAGDYDA
ncbi:hypothetical protein B296_00023068 [Ensete ventricosum]|uniref:Uncharacterized protein n=1 Tax=Ensete ventricosum TaxID=4639 RepID=A0A427AFZ8_ENSVE|nr:hypothetical protein B296_00023068 [Ensete ventricosum]